METILNQIYEAFKNEKYKQMKKISKHALNRYILTQNTSFFHLAVLSYVLYKILNKNRFSKKEYSEQMKNILKELSELNNEFTIEKLNEIKRKILELESKDSRYIFDFFTKANVKMAAILYAKGISLDTCSKISNIPKAEILSYAGKTMMFDRLKEENTYKERMKIARRLIE